MAPKRRRLRKEDREICQLVKVAHEQEMAELLEEFAGAEDHVFSAEFERKMEELFARIARNIRHREIRRYIAAAAVVIFILWSVSHPQYYVEATRVIIEWFEEMFILKYTGEPIKEDVRVYQLGYVPEGYELIYQFRDERQGKHVYACGEDIIEFHYLKSDWRAAVNGENVSLKDISVDLKKDVYYLEASDLNYQSSLIWMSEDGNVLFSITSDVGYEELLKMCKSVEEVMP